MSNDNKRKLYDALSKEYDMGTFEQFCIDLNDDSKRRKLYDATSLDYDFGSWDRFSQQLGYSVANSVEPQGHNPQMLHPSVSTIDDGPIVKASTTTEHVPQGYHDEDGIFHPYPISDTATDTATSPVSQAPTGNEGQESWQPSPMQKAKIINAAKSTVSQFNAQGKATMDRLKNATDYFKHGEALTRQPAKGDVRFNPESGYAEQTYITPTGTKTADKLAAEHETRAYNDYVDNMTVAGQLRRAGRDLNYLTDKADKRRAEIIAEVRKRHQENEPESLISKIYQGIRGGDAMTMPSDPFMDEVNDILSTDREYRSFEAARHDAENRVRTLQHENDRQEGKDVGFWRCLGEVVSDVRTWDFGLGDLRDMTTKFAVSSKPDGTRSLAEDMMLEQEYEAQAAEAAYGQNESFWGRAGAMTGEMLPFMIDFFLTGGASGGTTAVTRNIDALLLRSLHKAVPNVARKKAVQWTTKVFGAMPEDLLFRAPMMTNTVQGMKTGADIIDRKLGDVIVRDDGTYDFSNDKTWGSAIWQSEANSIIENYSEIFGSHLGGIMSLESLSKIANTFGANRLGLVLAKASNSELAGIAGTMQKHLNRLGVSDYIGEVSEEYYGQLWRTMLNLDDAYRLNPDGTRTNLLFDGQFHGDIWGGMALSMGLMGAGKYTMSAAAYSAMKHQVNKSDKRASEIFTPEVWEGWRQRIDETTNSNIGGLAESIVADPSLTDGQKAAAISYMETSLILRGFNLASVARQRGGEQSPEETAVNESYMDGYSATAPQEMNDAKRMLDLQRQRLASALSEDVVHDFDADPIGALSRTHDPDTRRIAADYVNAKAVYDGMIQRVRDDIDGRIAQSDAMIDGRVNRTTGMIQPATMRSDGKETQVYVVDGELAMFEDGSGVDTQNSSESIIIRDAETGKVEFADPSRFVSADNGIDAETEKEVARQQIRQEVAQAAANKIDGVLSFTPGDTYNVLDMDGQPQEVSVVGQPVDENGVPVEGQINIQYPDGQIQQVAMSDLQQQVDAANAQRVENFVSENAETVPNIAENAENLTENGENITESVPNSAESVENVPQSALSRIPVDDNGGYRFDAVDPETAWDGMVEFMENEDDASEYAAAMVDESEAAVKKAEQAITKVKPTNDPAKFKADKAAARTALSEAQRQVEHWRYVVGVASSRRAAIEEAARQQAEAERAAQIAAEARREAEQQAEARRKAEEDAAAPREYAKAYAGWEQPATFEEYVLRRLSAGGMKLKWGKNERTGTNGLGAMLGYGSGTREQQGLLWLLDNANGYYPEEAAERMLVDFKAETGMEPNIDAMDAHNTLLDVIATHGSSRAMWTEAKRRHDAMEATAPVDEEYERQREWYETRFGMSPEEYESYGEQVYSDIAAHEISEDEMSDFIATFADAILTEQKEREEYERNREHDNSAAGSLRERGDGILPEERPDIDTGDNPPVQRPQEADGNGNRPDGGSPQESRIGRTLNAYEAQDFIVFMEESAEVAPEIPLTPQNWATEFGTDGIINTPIGKVKQGDNQYLKLAQQGRNGKLGMIKPTLEHPSIIIEDERPASDGSQDRITSYVFIRTFVKKDGSRYYHFASITVSKDGKEVVISSQERSANRISKLLQQGKVAWIDERFSLHPTTQIEESVPLNDSNKPTSTDNQPALLGINSSELSSSKENLVWKHADNVSDASDVAQGLYSSRGKTSDPASEGTDAPQTNIISEDKITISSAEKQAEPVESSMNERIAAAEAEVNTTPTDAQKAAGNYKKGHVQVGTFDVTIENPAGSVRSGVDADGKPWSNTMHNTYGYIRGTVGVDGDHIDVFLSDSPEEGDVFVVDQINPETGEFDEHKVMYGFPSEQAAREAYLSNYEPGWTGLGAITHVTKDEFKKWVESSKRKTKPFADYSTVSKITGEVPDMDVAIAKLGERIDALTARHSEMVNEINRIRERAAENLPHIKAVYEKRDRIEREAEKGKKDDKLRRDAEKEMETVRAQYPEEAKVYDELMDLFLELMKQRDDLAALNHNLRTKKHGLERYGDLVYDADDIEALLKKADEIFGQRDKASIRNEASSKTDDKSFSIGYGVPQENRAVYDATVKMLQDAGIKVHEVSGDEAQAMLREKITPVAGLPNRANEKQSSGSMLQRAMGDSSSNAPNSVEAGAKIENNTQSAKNNINKFHNGDFMGGKMDVSTLDKALSALGRMLSMRSNGGSRYSLLHTEGGAVVAIRLSDHRANGNNFKRDNANRNLSIVIERKKFDTPDSEIEFTEAVIPMPVFEAHPHEVVSAIVKGVEDVLADKPFSLDGSLGSVTGHSEESPQFHIRTYHGTGAEFDRFDFSHMGSGEGVQAYGWGGYVTEVKGIGKGYATAIGGNELIPKIEKVTGNISQVRKWLRENEDYDKYVRRGNRHLKELQREYSSAEKDGNEKDMTFYKGLIDLQENALTPESHAALIADKQFQIDGYQKELDGLNAQMAQRRHLYTVSIPDDTGSNYLDWDGKIPDEIRKKVILQAAVEGVSLDYYGEPMSAAEYFSKMGEDAVGFQLYRALTRALGSDKAASGMLSRAGLTGIKYAADHNNGGRADGKKNYTIFNEGDMRIKNHVQFMSDREGDVYGWTVGGEVFLNRDAINPETPLHEYTHLWDAMVRERNLELWRRGVELMRQTPIWDEVVNDPNYSGIRDDEDAIASEVHSRLTGRDGAALLSRMIDESRGEGAFAVAERVTLVERLKEWLRDMFNAIKETLGKWTKSDLEGLTPEQFSQMPLRDLAEGLNPSAESRTHEGENDIRFRFIGEHGAARLDKAMDASIRMDNLTVAREMEESGKSDKAIKLATGWERGADRKWRYEEADGKFVKPNDFEGTFRLPEIWDDENLYTAYPSLKETKVEFVDIPKYAGLFHPSDNKIEIDTKKVRDIRSVLVHEIQHAIQEEEGFAKGGTGDYAFTKLIATNDYWLRCLFEDFTSEQLESLSVLRDMADKMIDDGEYKRLPYAIRRAIKIAKENNFYAFYDHDSRDDVALTVEDALLNFTMDELHSAAMKYANVNTDDLYKRISGEVEARNVQNRIGLNPERRRKSLASSTEDVAREDQIFLRETLGAIMNEQANEMPATDISETNARFNEQLKRWENGNMRTNEIFHLGSPHGVMKMFLPQLPIVMRQKVMTKGVLKKHNAVVSSLIDMPSHLSSPIFVFKRSEDTIGVLTEQKDRDGKNICVAIELKRNMQDGGEILEVNDIRSFHGREFKNIISPIVNNHTLQWVDKEKGLAYLSSASQPVQQEIDKQELEDAANIIKDFENPAIEGDEISERGGEGAYTDEELSMANDPWSKAWGESLRTKRQQKEFAARERKRMAERVKMQPFGQLLDNVEVVTDASTLSGKRATAKGFFNNRTGKITIVLPNNSSAADIEQTLLHEAVAHYGLRKLLGNHFDEFLDKVYEAADETIKARIDVLAIRNGWNRRVATEEYMAGLAEDADFDKAQERIGGWFSKIKHFFIDMLRKVGFKNISPYSLRDNELRYILWRSYQNLANPGRYRAFEWEAEDVAMQYGLSVGEYAMHDAITESHVAEAGELYEINERFNEQLSHLTEDNADSIYLNLGKPSRILLVGGVSNREMKLYGNKVIKKMKKHGFKLSELKNLPEAVAHPIAVFNNLERNGNRSILTELSTTQGNFLVTIDLGKGVDVDFNIVSSVFGKRGENIIDWILNGKMTAVNKRKALDFLFHQSAPIAATAAKQELDDAAKIVERFENPTINEQNNNVEDDGDVRFRDGDFTPRDRKLAATQYERMLSRGSWQFKEAVQDSMLGLKTLYESILGKGTRIEDVAGYENAYLYENRMSSANNGEQHQYFIQYMKPLLDSIYDLCGNDKLERRILTDYMMAKHGLERNEKMRVEAAAKKEDTDRDFAGLCGLTGEDSWISAEAEAQKMVDEYERNHDTTELWENVRKATNATLEKIYLSGLMSDETFNKVQGMYDFYIPLRGWDETTSNEVYGYLTSNDGPLTGNVFKKATGRKSKADDPIATIAMMADDAIRQGNRNIMKQRFLNFVHGNPSDLVSINDMWLQHDDVTDEWKPVFAKLKPDMTREEVESEVAKFEAKMERLKKSEPDKYARGNDACNIPYKVINSDLREHQVLVKRNGRTYVMTINGNPRAAQALNGLTNPDVEMGGVVGNLLKGAEYVNRNLSAFYTTRNPDFVVSNFMRDTLYSNCMAWVKESPSYALRFHKNFGKVNPFILGHLLHKWENGTLDDSNKLERMFKEFMLNGGETGYTSVKDIEGHKRTIASELKKHGNIGRKAWSALGMQLDLLNRSAENCARFAAFLTSREMGRTLDRSIYDAKEVSVNFNKKGSGGKFVNATGQTTLGKIGASISGSGRILYVFWNAGVQGMTNFGRAAKRHPGKALGGAAALFTLGYVIPLLAQICGSGDGDDDKNAYYNLPEHIRRSNICFHVGDQWITIPLPIEYRAIYGMGELACGVISGNERYSNSELAYHMAAQVSQVMPLDILEGDGGFSAFIPSAVKPVTEAYVMNKSWSGLPIYKDTPFNKNDPEWTKAYQSADQHLVAFTKWLNETRGGDDYKKGTFDINPAKIEYLLSGTFGGVFTTFENLKKTGETIIGKREFEWRNTPIANRIVKSGDERTANRKLQNEYFKYFEEYEETKRLYRKYDNAAANGILGYAEKANFLYNSPEYLRLETFEKYKPDIDAFRAQLKEETDPKKKKEIQAEMFGTMRELVDSLRVVGQ